MQSLLCSRWGEWGEDCISVARQTLIKLSGCSVGTSSALRLTAQHLSQRARAAWYSRGHGTPSAVAGGSVAQAQAD